MRYALLLNMFLWAIIIAAVLLLHSHVGAEGYRLLPECEVRAVVGDDLTQLDLVWLDNGSVVEYAYPTQYQAAERISLIETEFACNVRWERV